MRMHNTYSILYNQLVFNVIERRFGRGEAVVFARSSTVGGQRYPVVCTPLPARGQVRQADVHDPSIGEETASRHSRQWLKA